MPEPAGAEPRTAVATATDVCAAASEASEQTVPAGIASEADVPEDIRSVSEETAAEADAVCGRYGAVGVQAAVMRGGRVRYTYEYGFAVREERRPVTRDTKFRVASLSKFVTDLVFMRLLDEGKTALDENIETYLGYPVRNPSYPDRIITPRMLMTHTSSVIDSSAFLEAKQQGSSVPLEELLQYRSSYSGSEPGKAYSYSNFGIAVLGAVCEKAACAPLEKLAREFIFDPLQIDAAFAAADLAEPSQLAVLYGCGGLTAERQLAEAFCDELGQTYHLAQGNLTVSAADYAAVLCRVYRDANDAGDGVILSKESANAMFRPQYANEGFGQRRSDRVIDGVPLCCHTGSNFGMFSAFAFSPDNGDGVVILTSGADTGIDGESEIYDICLDLIRLLMEKDIGGGESEMG